MRLFIVTALFSLTAVASPLDEGLHALTAGNYPLASQQLAFAVAERPHDPIAHFNYASALRQLGQNDDAVGEYQAALREARDPNLRSDVLYGMALARNQMGDPARAAAAWRDYLSFAGDQEPGATEIARENLAAAERSLGTRKAAR